MYLNEKKKYADVSLKKLIIRLICGAKQIYRMNYGKIAYVCAVIGIGYLWSKRELLYSDIDNIALININFVATTFLIVSAVLWMFSKPIIEYMFSKAFHRAGIVNHVSDTPILFDVEIGKSKDMKTYIFLTQGIPLTTWRDKISELENALNLCIHSIEQGDNKQFVEVCATSGNYKFPKKIEWNDSYIPEEDNLILVGESYGMKKYADIDLSPSFLLGGSTGSGKSVLLKTILYQFIKRGHIVFLADFKGGVDFQKFWHENTRLIVDVDSVISVLSEIIEELEERKIRYAQKGYSNIKKYNEGEAEKDKRIVFACDEVAELLDKSGLEKEDKEKVNKIERMIGTIARQGRAFGIHLVLCTQRPDANVLSGQIKNNLEHKFCGRCENVLSQIVLDTTSAADLVPKKESGVFLDSEEILFKGYYLDL